MAVYYQQLGVDRHKGWPKKRLRSLVYNVHYLCNLWPHRALRNCW